MNENNEIIYSDDIKGASDTRWLSDGTLHIDIDPVAVYGKRPDMIDNTVGTPTKGIRDKGLHYMSYPLAFAFSLPVLAYGAEGLAAAELELGAAVIWQGMKEVGKKMAQYGTKLLQNGITNPIVKDILVGSTTSLIADQAVRTFTPYNGIADGMLRTTFGDDIQYNPYYNYMLFGTEMINPVNLIAPWSIASKTNLYRKFDNFGNNVTANGMINPDMNFNNTSKFNQLGKQYINNINNSPDIYYNGNNLNKRVQATLQNIYNRDRYIEQNLEYGPTMWIDNLDNNTMLINGSNVSTGVTPKYGGITNGNSRPHFNNGYYVPATGDIHFKWGETILSNQHPIFFSPNSPFKELPHGKSFDITYDNLITTAPKNQFKNDHLKYMLNVEKTSDQIPYRFVETKYNPSLNGTLHETPFGIEVRVPRVPIKNIVGHEYDPLLKTFRRHVYTDYNTNKLKDDDIVIFETLNNK